jgi:DNA-binding MarR family transcriptional regulator
MMILNRNPDQGLCPADLADKSGVTRATMTGLLDGLERDGLVAREGHLADRRMLMVRLTTKGREFLDKIVPGYLRKINDLMAPLTEQEKHTAADLLARLGGHVLTVDGTEGKK